VKLGRPHQEETDQHRDIGSGVDRETPAIADGHHQQTRESRTENAGDAASRPTANPLPVILSTSRVRATLVSQLPVFETS